MDKPERAKRIMSTATRKAKGRKFQQWVASKLQEVFELPPEDVVSNSMGNQGEDIRLSAKAKDLFPYSVECKAGRGFSNVYKAFDQSKANKGNCTPVVMIKGDYREPLVILEFKDYINLCLQKM